MKKLKTYEQYLNESSLTEAKKKFRGPGDKSYRYRPTYTTLEKFANKIVTKKNFPRNSSKENKYDKETLVSAFRYDMKLKDDTTVKFADLPNLPGFDDLYDEFKTVILSMTGFKGKSKNKKFIKEFLKAFGKWPQLPDRNEDPHDYLGQALYIRERFEKGTYPFNYYMMSSDARKLREYGITVADLPQEERAFLQKSTKKKFERVIKGIDDKLFKDAINREVGIWHDKNSDEANVAANIGRMPELFAYMKELMTEGQAGRDVWKKFTAKTKMTKSDHSSVVASSFSTYYYYDVDVKFNGKSFKFKDVQLGSSYYSGGWN